MRFRSGDIAGGDQVRFCSCGIVAGCGVCEGSAAMAASGTCYMARICGRVPTGVGGPRDAWWVVCTVCLTVGGCGL